MKHPFLKRSICLLLAVLSVLAMPASALEEVAQAEEAQAAVQTDPFDVTEETEPEATAPEPEEPETPAVEIPAVFVDEKGNYLAPEELSVYVMRHMEEDKLSNPSQTEDRYTGVVAFYDYNVTNEQTRLEHPCFFYYEKGRLQDEAPAFHLARGYLDLTEAPVADSSVNPAASAEGDKLVYVAEERYVAEEAEEHPAYLFAFGQKDGENGLYTGAYEEETYADGLPVPAEPETPEEEPLPVQPAAALGAEPEDPADPADPEPEAPQPEDPEPEVPVVERAVPAVTAKVVVGGIQVSWKQDAEATGYRVYRKVSGGKWARVADVAAGTASYLDARAVSDTTYSYTVRSYFGDAEAIAGDQNYASDNWSNFSPTKDVYYLAAPVTSYVSNDTQITITWNKVPGADSYRIWRTTGDSPWGTGLATVSGDSLSYTDNSAKSGVHYYYAVRAYNKSRDYYGLYYDDRTDASKSICLHTTPAVQLAATATGIKVSWGKDAEATGYRVYRKVPGGGWTVLSNVTSGATTSYLDKTVKNGQSYSYAVRAYYGEANKLAATNTTQAALWSSYASVSLIYLNTPQFTAIYSGGGYMNVQWTAISKATGYLIYRRSSPSDSWTKLAFVTGGTSYQDKTVANGKTYYYAIRAYQTDSTGVKNYSVNTNQTTPVVYHAPLTVSVSTIATGCRVTWNLDARATGYRVYRQTGSTITAIANISAASLQKGAATATFTDSASGLKGGQTYSYTVRAYYGSDPIKQAKTAEASDWNSFTWNQIVYLPIPKPEATATNEPTGIKVKWSTVTGAAGYYVYRRIGSGSWSRVATVTGGTTNAYIDTTATKLTSGTVCYYTIRAFSGKENDLSYFDTTGSCAVYLPRPSEITVSAPASNGTTVKWSAVKGATLYEVLRKPENGSSWTVVSAVSGTSFVDTGVKATGDRYYYTVRPTATVTVNGTTVTIAGDYNRDGYLSGLSWSGKERSAWVQKNGNTYYVDKSGLLLTGWQYLTRNGRQYKYYFDQKTGALVTNLYSYFGREYRDMKCRIEVCINTKNSNPSNVVIYLYDQATSSYCIPAVSFRCVANPTVTKARSSSCYLKSKAGIRWLNSNVNCYEEYATYISGTPSWFHSTLYKRDDIHSLRAYTYNSLADNVNNSLGCIRMQCIYGYLIQDITKNGYGARNRIPVSIYHNTAKPGPFGVPKMDKIGSRNSDPTDPAITGKFFYDTTVWGVSAKAGAQAWTYY